MTRPERRLTVMDVGIPYRGSLRNRFQRIRSVQLEREEFVKDGVVISTIDTIVVHWGPTWNDADTRCTRLRPGRLRTLRRSQPYSTTDVDLPGAVTAMNVTDNPRITVRDVRSVLRMTLPVPRSSAVRHNDGDATTATATMPDDVSSRRNDDGDAATATMPDDAATMPVDVGSGRNGDRRRPDDV